MRITNLLFAPFLIMVCFIACTHKQEPEVEDCSVLVEFSIINIIASKCGGAVGSIEVIADLTAGANNEILYVIDNQTPTSNPIFENLSAGSYEVKAMINEDCVKKLNAVVENEDGLNISIETTPASCEGTNGKIEITSTNASGSTLFTLSGGLEQSAETFDNLDPGTYEIVASDEAGCVIEKTVKVTSDVERAEVVTIVSTNCAVSGCHAGNVSPNFSVEENIDEFAQRIQQRTSNGSMPPSTSGQSLKESEISAIACWVFDKN